jgi:hypothetical protein
MKPIILALALILGGCAAGIEQLAVPLPDGTRHVSVVTHREELGVSMEAITQYHCDAKGCAAVSSGMQAPAGIGATVLTTGGNIVDSSISKLPTITLP